MYHPHANKPDGWQVLAVILFAAALALISSVLVARGVPGNRLAVGLALLLVALPILYPTMLREAGQAVSTMRVVVYVIVGLFSTITIRVAWNVSTLGDLKIDPWWATVVSAAIGGKVLQSLGESAVPADKERPTTPPQLPPRGPSAISAGKGR